MTEKDHRKTKNGIQKRLVIAKLVQELPAKLLAIVANQTCHFQGTYRLVTYLPILLTLRLKTRDFWLDTKIDKPFYHKETKTIE